MFEIVSALVPPMVVGGVIIAGVVHLMRSEARAKAAEAQERVRRRSSHTSPATADGSQEGKPAPSK
ncbi:hypothetical protein [Nonomuraea jiangxiensis]|uniref:hypothetical protein n=1 Tax=Nonomuraea jiangxiensis TaxID=633440 RepID=UPI000B8106BC|nr:hypothetical protein [Nonomuraea jiangxiensis]